MTTTRSALCLLGTFAPMLGVALTSYSYAIPILSLAGVMVGYFGGVAVGYVYGYRRANDRIQQATTTPTEAQS